MTTATIVAAIASSIVAVYTAERVAEINRVSLRSSLQRLNLAERKAKLGDGTRLDAIMAQPKRGALLAYLAVGATGAMARRDTVLALRNWAALQVRISIGLADGRWLNSWQHPSGGYEWWRLLRFSLPVSILPVLVLGYVFVRRIVRPVRALVDALVA